MVIGLKHFVRDGTDIQAKQTAAALAGKFLEQFRGRNGTLLCRDLIGCDISTDEGRRKARELGLFKMLCPKFVKDAAEIVEAILAENG